VADPCYGKILTEFAANHRWVPQTTFKLLHVIEPVRMGSLSEYRSARDEINRQDLVLNELAKQIETAIPDSNIICDVRQGYAKEEILRDANEWPADLIIVGSHGRSTSECLFLGSVSLAVTAHAPCTVTIVRIANVKTRLKVQERARKHNKHHTVKG
jgi:nucleotide-binding universal stress UspA family protein